MKVFLYILAAIVGYFVSGINPAIVLSRAIYKQDIRECGSKNPGFTNFKRCFGNKWAWVVLLFDLTKAAVVIVIFAFLLSRLGEDFQFAAAYTGAFCMIGHAYPMQYKFKGGKGFLVCLSTVYVVDFRVGLICTAILVLLLLITKYMSLSTTVAMLLCPIALALLGSSIWTALTVGACAVFMAIRHRENFRRLVRGEESKFSLKSKKQ